MTDWQADTTRNLIRRGGNVYCADVKLHREGMPWPNGGNR